MPVADRIGDKLAYRKLSFRKCPLSDYVDCSQFDSMNMKKTAVRMNRLQVHGKIKLMHLCVEDLFHEQPKQYWLPVNDYHNPGTYKNTDFSVNKSNGTYSLLN